LAKSQGEEWVKHLSDEFSQVISGRVQLVALDEKSTRALGGFVKATEDLSTAVRAIAESAQQRTAASAQATAKHSSHPRRRLLSIHEQ